MRRIEVRLTVRLVASMATFGFSTAGWAAEVSHCTPSHCCFALRCGGHLRRHIPVAR